MHGQLLQPCAHPQPSRGELTDAPGLLQVGTRSPKSRTAERAHSPPHRGVHRGGTRTREHTTDHMQTGSEGFTWLGLRGHRCSSSPAAATLALPR